LHVNINEQIKIPTPLFETAKSHHCKGLTFILLLTEEQAGDF